ncbi:MAG TPA: hypothetical protein PK610_09425, partial [Flavobacteriales bacterium]|nr:hypothetical protein [Flavobacteriales bacterium]
HPGLFQGCSVYVGSVVQVPDPCRKNNSILTASPRQIVFLGGLIPKPILLGSDSQLFPVRELFPFTFFVSFWRRDGFSPN